MDGFGVMNVMGVRLGVMDVVAGINGDLGDLNRVGVGA